MFYHIIPPEENYMVILRHSYHLFLFATLSLSLWSGDSVTNLSFETDPKYYQISSFLLSSTPSTYTTISHLLHNLQLLKNITTTIKSDERPDVIPDVISDVKPNVNPDINPDVKLNVKPDLNPDVNPDVKPVVNSAVKPTVEPNLNPAVKSDCKTRFKPDYKPELLPISSIEVEFQRQTKSIIETDYRITFIVSQVFPYLLP